jgi:hypothetical protein
MKPESACTRASHARVHPPRKKKVLTTRSDFNDNTKHLKLLSVAGARVFLYHCMQAAAANPSVTQSNRTITSELWSGRKDRVAARVPFSAPSIHPSASAHCKCLDAYALCWVMCMCGEEPIGGTSRRKRKVICPGACVSTVGAIIAFGEPPKERRRSLWVLRTARTPPPRARINKCVCVREPWPCAARFRINISPPARTQMESSTQTYTMQTMLMARADLPLCMRVGNPADKLAATPSMSISSAHPRWKLIGENSIA